MLLVNLYNSLKRYELDLRLSYDEFFRNLRHLIGSGEYSYFDNHGYLSKRQCCVSENAIQFIMMDRYRDAVRETLDFMHNYQDNKHDITYEEYVVLNCILTCYEKRSIMFEKVY